MVCALSTEEFVNLDEVGATFVCETLVSYLSMTVFYPNFKCQVRRVESSCVIPLDNLFVLCSTRKKKSATPLSSTESCRDRGPNRRRTRQRYIRPDPLPDFLTDSRLRSVERVESRNFVSWD